jgi:hypothetical protein
MVCWICVLCLVSFANKLQETSVEDTVLSAKYSVCFSFCVIVDLKWYIFLTSVILRYYKYIVCVP